MRFLGVLFWGLGGMAAAVGIGLLGWRVVEGPVNVFLPGLGLVVAVEVFVVLFLVAAAVCFGLGVLVRRVV